MPDSFALFLAIGLALISVSLIRKWRRPRRQRHVVVDIGLRSSWELVLDTKNDQAA